MDNTEKAVTWGLLGLIAWELWQSSAPPSPGTDLTTIGDNIPLWVKQLSRHDNQIDFFHKTGGLWGCS